MGFLSRAAQETMGYRTGEALPDRGVLRSDDAVESHPGRTFSTVEPLTLQVPTPARL